MDRGDRGREKEPSASVMIRGLKPTTSPEMVWKRKGISGEEGQGEGEGVLLKYCRQIRLRSLDRSQTH
jgi:hypothetical protein